MNSTLQQLMQVATKLTRAGRLNEATAAIQRALRGSASKPEAPRGTVYDVDSTVVESTVDLAAALPPPADFPVADREAEAHSETVAAFIDAAITPLPVAPAPVAPRQVGDEQDIERGEGEFISGSYLQGSQNHRYKLFVPPGHAGRQLPLVVMLHGCTQDPDDFAAGTGMNAAAEERGFFVLYPAQSRGANSSRCWNWFKHQDQLRDQGEPALLADMTLSIMNEYDVDPRRVFIAGLSAGGAMAAIVADLYPEIFAAAGVHSGLPRGAASSVMEAFSVMRSGEAGRLRAGPVANAPQLIPVPTIVFHGDKDQTVHPRNGEQVLAAALGSATDALGSATDAAKVERGVTAHGRHYTRTVHRDHLGNAKAEHWLVHGAGHAWSGGHAAGSYTDAKGPDATRAMLQFFFDQPVGAGPVPGMQH